MYMKDERKILETLQADINLRLAPSDALAVLARSAQRVRFGKGEYVFEAGDDSKDFHIVESGRVILSKESPSGKVFTFMIAIQGMPLNAITCFRSGTRFLAVPWGLVRNRGGRFCPINPCAGRLWGSGATPAALGRNRRRPPLRRKRLHPE